jgi:hypothetical protein
MKRINNWGQFNESQNHQDFEKHIKRYSSLKEYMKANKIIFILGKNDHSMLNDIQVTKEYQDTESHDLSKVKSINDVGDVYQTNQVKKTPGDKQTPILFGLDNLSDDLIIEILKEISELGKNSYPDIEELTEYHNKHKSSMILLFTDPKKLNTTVNQAKKIGMDVAFINSLKD